MRKGLIALLACVIPGFCTGLWAGSRTEDSASGFSLRRYEFSVSGAAYPGYCAFGYDFNYPYYQYNIENIYTRFAYDERETSTGTWTAAFTYNFTKILALETSISYEGGRLRNSRKPDAVGIISPGPGGDMPDLTESLDVSVLQEKLLRPILGIEDIRNDERIDFVGGAGGIQELEIKTKNGMSVAFCMYPVTVAKVMEVSDAGLTMPPKSTWFEPKPASGLFIHLL